MFMLLQQKISYTYNHKISRIIWVSTTLTVIICRISLQFSCKLIDSNKANLEVIKNAARFIRLPVSILWVIHSMFILQSLIESYSKPKGKKETAKIVGKSAGLVSDTTQILIQVKIIHFLVGYNKSAVYHVDLASTILSIFVAGPIGFYYSYKKYQDNKDTKKCTEYKNALIFETLIFSSGLLNCLLKMVEVTTIPINLGNDIIYNFNISVTISIIYSTLFLAHQADRLFSQPPSGLDYPNADAHSNVINSNDEFPSSIF